MTNQQFVCCCVMVLNRITCSICMLYYEEFTVLLLLIIIIIIMHSFVAISQISATKIKWERIILCLFTITGMWSVYFLDSQAVPARIICTAAFRASTVCRRFLPARNLATIQTILLFVQCILSSERNIPFINESKYLKIALKEESAAGFWCTTYWDVS